MRVSAAVGVLLLSLAGSMARAQEPASMDLAPEAIPFVAFYQAGGTGGVAVPQSDVFIDFPELSITFNLPSARVIAIVYKVVASASISAGHFITTVTIDGVEQVPLRDITGSNFYWSNGGTYGALLGAGNHTVKVRYRATSAGTCDPANSDIHARKLMVGVF